MMETDYHNKQQSRSDTTPASDHMLVDNTHFPVLYISNRYLKKGLFKKGDGYVR